MAKKIRRVKKPGKLEGKKIIGARISSDEGTCYIHLQRADGKVDEYQLRGNYHIVVGKVVVSRHYGSGE